jgi:hypothetical protein
MAIAAFVLGLLGFVGISAILGIIFGIIALSTIRGRLQRGKGLAVAGIVLGSAWLVLFIVLIVIGIVQGAGSSPPSSSSAGASSQRVVPWSLVAGDCFDYPTPTPGQQQTVNTVLHMPCTQSHNAQVFATVTVSGSLLSYPGTTRLENMASSDCPARAKERLNSAKVTSSMSVRYLYPEESSWLAGNRTITCLVYSPTPVTLSLLAS